ncbi:MULTISPECIES: phosphoribosyltransferase domain-containing protein [Psychrobacter]|uniref:phosphoribosyltransferase domain-containing protein n=1 Tax=Psychrobacter TaxID=497 RepID=UPI00146E261E|nr:MULTISPECIES: phosphoribosyltransferase domain-containing protein [Psychrobacter]
MTQNLNSPSQLKVTLPRGTLNLTYQSNPDVDNSYDISDLLDFAQRINPKRAFLFVSKVLGRHIPVAPSVMRRAFSDLASLIPDDLPEPILVLGMAETAVGLSAGVHQVLQSRYPNALLLNSTRHAFADPNAKLLATFSEDHSHASRHLIYQSDDEQTQSAILNTKTLIMVDDEASTGNTCRNVVNALTEAGLNQLELVHLATLVDWSLDSAADLQDTKDIHFFRQHLLAGNWQWSDAPNPTPITMPRLDTTAAGSKPVLPTGNWGRQPTLDSTSGFGNYLANFWDNFSRKFGDNAPLPNRILMLGSNEFVWLPFLLAENLEQEAKLQSSTHQVCFSALTRSPIAMGGAISATLSFRDNYGLGMTNFVYNVEPSAWELIVLCVETPTDSVDELWRNLDNVLIVSPEPSF